MLFAKFFLIIMLTNQGGGIATIPMATADVCMATSAIFNADKTLPAVATCISTGFQMPGSPS